MAEAIEQYKADLAHIARDVFETMLGIEVEPVEEPWEPAPDRMTGAVYLAGSWRGAVLLECGTRQACDFAGRLMPIPTPEQVNDDVRDTLGELANMVGGNLKAVLPPGATLSMPSVVEGIDYSLRICGGNANVQRLACSCSTGVFWITLIELPL